MGFVLVGFLIQKGKESKRFPFKPFLSSVNPRLTNPDHHQGTTGLQNAKKYECLCLVQASDLMCLQDLVLQTMIKRKRMRTPVILEDSCYLVVCVPGV